MVHCDTSRPPRDAPPHQAVANRRSAHPAPGGQLVQRGHFVCALKDLRTDQALKPQALVACPALDSGTGERVEDLAGAYPEQGGHLVSLVTSVEQLEALGRQGPGRIRRQFPAPAQFLLSRVTEQGPYLGVGHTVPHGQTARKVLLRTSSTPAYRVPQSLAVATGRSGGRRRHRASLGKAAARDRPAAFQDALIGWTRAPACCRGSCAARSPGCSEPARCRAARRRSRCCSGRPCRRWGSPS